MSLNLIRSCRSWFHSSSLLRIIPVSHPIATPNDFLKAIGRSSHSKLSLDSWHAFWNTRGREMKKAGLSVRDRKCVLAAFRRAHLIGTR
jgi:IGR protein motif